MGNTALQRDYAVSDVVSASGGNGHLWRVYPAVHKATKQEVCVFMATKKDIETQYGPQNANTILNRLKLEAQLLARLRHPNILNLHNLYVDSSKDVYMITEPILGSLSNLLKDYTNIPQPMDSIKNFDFFPVEVRAGMCQIAEALEYCHNEVKLAHLNICPENIYVTTQGTWKLAGFNFSFFESYQKATEVPQAIINNRESIVKFGQRLQRSSYLPSLNYSAPEFVVHNQPSLASDIFSFGVLYYDLVSGMPTPQRGLLFSSRNIEIYKQRVMGIRSLDFRHMPKTMADSLLNTLSDNPKTRLEIHIILSQMSLFGNDVNALRILSSIEMRDAFSKAKFLRSLPPTLESLPERVLIHRTLPPLLGELKDMKTATFALPSIFIIAEKMSSKQYSRFIQPELSRIYVQMQPPELPLKLLENFELMMNKSSPAEKQNFVLPFLVRCLECNVLDVQIDAMKQAEKCFTNKLISAQEFKNLLLPKIDTLIRKTQSSIVRTNGAVCLGKTSPNLETDVLVQIIVPCLEHCLKVDTSASLVMTVVGVFNRISKLMKHKHIVALRILPAVIPVAVNTALTEEQFVKLMRAVKGMIGMVEHQRMDTFSSASMVAREAEQRRGTEQLQQKQVYPDVPPQPLSTNGAQSESISTDDLFGVPSQAQITTNDEGQEKFDDFLTRHMSSAKPSSSEDLFNDGDAMLENLLRGTHQQSFNEQEKTMMEKKEETHHDLDNLMNRFMPDEGALSATVGNKNQISGNDLFGSLEEEWKNDVMASEKPTPRSKPEQTNAEQTIHMKTRDATSSSFTTATPSGSDFDALLDMVSLRTDENYDESMVSKPTIPSSALFDDSDPFSRINIESLDDDDDDESYSRDKLQHSTVSASNLEDSFYNEGSFYGDVATTAADVGGGDDDDDDDESIGNSNITEMMASLGATPASTQHQRTKSYFDDDDDDDDDDDEPLPAFKPRSNSRQSSDLDDLMSRFM